MWVQILTQDFFNRNFIWNLEKALIWDKVFHYLWNSDSFILWVYYTYKKHSNYLKTYKREKYFVLVTNVDNDTKESKLPLKKYCTITIFPLGVFSVWARLVIFLKWNIYLSKHVNYDIFHSLWRLICKNCFPILVRISRFYVWSLI